MAKAQFAGLSGSLGGRRRGGRPTASGARGWIGWRLRRYPAQPARNIYAQSRKHGQADCLLRGRSSLSFGRCQWRLPDGQPRHIGNTLAQNV